MKASRLKKPSRRDSPDDFQYPLRERGDLLRFYGYLFILPILLVLFAQLLFGRLLFPEVPRAHLLWATLLHGIVLGVFLLLLWIPAWLTITNWRGWIENTIIYARNALLIIFIIVLFPHALVQHFLTGLNREPGLMILYWSFIILLALIYFVFSCRKVHHSAFRDIRAAEDPQKRRNWERWLWFESLSFFLLLAGVIVVEMWFLATIGRGEFTYRPGHFFTQELAKIQTAFQDAVQRDQALTRQLMVLLAWFSCSTFSALVFFLTACLGNRLMSNILIPVTFHERDFRGIIGKSYRYLKHFATAMLLKYPFLLIGGFVLTFIFLIAPIIFIAAGRHTLLDDVAQSDQIILLLGIFVAWFSPLTLATVHPDDTFGEYFSRRVANLLMMVQGHLVIIGFGSLGKRVLDREVRLMQRKVTRNKQFMEVVTPDIRLESLCTHAVVIERDPKDVIFSGQDELLGQYGVVSTAQESFKSKDPGGNIGYDEHRALVPVVIGEAREPFISSRVNLERARLIISTVTEEESVQAIFDRANKAHVKAIICVSRSDQIASLTYRARHRPIVLVYPKHTQGITLGHRLWAAMLKVRSIHEMSVKKWPRILILGNSKANQFMLETLWTYLPGNHAERTQLLKKNFAFIVTSTEPSVGYPILKEAGKDDPFDLRWPALFVTGSRFPYKGRSKVEIKNFLQNVRVINEADQNAFQACILQHKPHILVINHDDGEKSPLLLSRCIRALERIKSRQNQKFRLPLILLTENRGDERERQMLGDASRYYDSICRMHNEPVGADASYPTFARYAYYSRDVIGETISDALADAEEIIAGARRSFSVFTGSDKPASATEETPNQFIEISSCLPNRPGTLANFLARLAGIEFSPPRKTELEKLWIKDMSGKVATEPYMPSFQYLRNIILDPGGCGFALTGYASLVPILEDSPILELTPPGSSSVVRIFANDGRNYLDSQVDPDELYDPFDKNRIQKKLQHIINPPPPGVPNVIDRLTHREKDKPNTIGEFRDVLLNPADKGKFACPGMSMCRVAAYQDYVAASNYRRLGRLAERGDTYYHEKLWHARNYYCCTGMKYAREEEIPTADSAYARIFCCSYGVNVPGQIALVLNTLIFRSRIPHSPASSLKEDDWAINIDYFSDVSCQNSHFAFNRVFGFFEKKPQEHWENSPELPLHLIRILPIGGVDSARLWFAYARALFCFLHQGLDKPRFKFYWRDGNHQDHQVPLTTCHAKEAETENADPAPDYVPKFNEHDRGSFPMVLVIKRIRDEYIDPERCKICGLEPREYDCSKLRVWI